MALPVAAPAQGWRYLGVRDAAAAAGRASQRELAFPLTLTDILD
jgi:hypothetical protein